MVASSLVFLILASIVPAIAQDENDQTPLNGRYFLVVWSYQGPDDDVVHAHTFTSFYRGDDLARGAVRPATISWLPATGVVQPFGVEKGRNFSLVDTLSMACHAHRRVKSWGPYEIKPELYQSAKKRIRLLESGSIAYSMIDAQPHAMNCITAAGDITPQHLDTGILWGVAASAAVVHHLSPYFVGDGHALRGLADLLKGKACRGHVAQITDNSNNRSIAQSIATSLGR